MTALTLDRHDVGRVQQPIQQGRRQRGIAGEGVTQNVSNTINIAHHKIEQHVPEGVVETDQRIEIGMRPNPQPKPQPQSASRIVLSSQYANWNQKSTKNSANSTTLTVTTAFNSYVPTSNTSGKQITSTILKKESAIGSVWCTTSNTGKAPSAPNAKPMFLAAARGGVRQRLIDLATGIGINGAAPWFIFRCRGLLPYVKERKAWLPI
jgi:hypothetical protein